MAYTKYPYQIKSIKNNKRILSVETRLSVSNGEQTGDRTAIPPLETPGYSVFKIFIIDDKKKAYSANLPEDDVAYLMMLSEKLIEFPPRKKSVGKNLSQVYTYKFPMGKVKGKTAAEILAAGDEGKELLLNQRKFLEGNAAKYKSNAAQMNIIDEALDLYAKNALKEVSGEEDTSEPIVLYETPVKYFSGADKTGKHIMYSLKIEKDPAKDMYPYKITIMNCKTTLRKNSAGLETADMKNAEDIVKCDISVSESDWYSFIKTISDMTVSFRNLMLAQQIVLAAEINKKNIAEAKR